MTVQMVLRSLYNNAKILMDDNIILAIWYEKSSGWRENWGDALNPILIQKISGKKPILITKYTCNLKNKTIYSVIGSILDGVVNNYRHDNLVIWGTGFISSQGKLSVRPKEICAVRGPLTREKLLNQGYKCPEIFGDPALLYPRFYKPNKLKKYKLGIIPHYVDKDHPSLKKFKNDQDILIIDILGRVHKVIDQICSCQKIASSALHGIIAADAYGIPSTWIKFTDKVVGDGFKFFDYFKSINREEEGPLVIKDNSTIDDILETYYKYSLDLDLNELWDVCPFR